MPTVQATRFTCPECGANLPVAGEDAATAKCSYCGTSARLQRRTKVMQRPVKLPPPKPDEPKRVARAKREWTVQSVLANAFFTLLFVGVFGGMAVIYYSDWHRDHTVQWRDIDTPRMIDADGDGVADVVGIGELGTDPQLVAVSGRDGHVLWHITPDDRKNPPHALGVIGETIVIADARGTLYAYEPKTGAQRWKADMPDEVYGFCADPSPSSFVVDMPSGAHQRVTTATGAVTPFAKAHDWECDHVLGSTEDGSVVGGTSVRGNFESATMDVALVYARGTGPRVVSGQHKGGRAIARLAAVEANGHVLWEHDVADGDPRDIETGGAYALGIADDTIVAEYHRSAPANGERVAGFDRTTGVRRFDVAARVIGKLNLGRDYFVIGNNACLAAYDLKTGASKWHFGCSDLF